MRLRAPLLAVALVAPGLALATNAAAAPSASSTTATTSLSPHVADVVLVGFRPGATGLERAAARRTVGAIASERVSPLAPDAEKLTLPAGYGVERAIAALSRSNGVRYAEPDYLVTEQVTSNDPYVTNGTLWGMYGDASSPANQYGSQAAEAWASGYTGSSSIAIGVIDEGIQVTHPDLVDNIWVNPSEANGTAGVDDDGNGYIDDINGWDFVSNDASVYDGGTTASADSHGTHVSGTIGGVGGNGAGVAGVNWDVTIVSGKFLGTSGGSTSNATRAVDYMTDLKTRHGLDIVATSNSWGGGGFSQTLLDAINRGGNNNILFVAAAGNSTSNNDTTASYPSNYQCTTATRLWDCVIGVAAIASDGSIASFSSYGATTVDLGAPGVSITSSLPYNSYGSYSGTSMATPHVSGAVALCASLNPALTGAELRSAVLSTTLPTTSLVGKVVNSGRLNVGSMVTTCAGSAGPISGNPSNLAAAASGATRMSLTWTDGVTNELNWTVERAPTVSSVCGTFAAVATIGANVSAFTDSGLTGATTYCYRVRATGSGGTTTSWSNTAQGTTATPPPPYVCSATTSSWVDPTVGGTVRTLSDDSSVLVTLPFTVTWYGTDQTTVNVSSNGYLRFGSGAATSYSNTAIPDATDPNGMAAAWWDDLNPAAGGTVYTSVQGSSPNRVFSASWVDINPYNTTGNPVTFQILIDEATDALTFQYLDASAATGSNGSSATVGVENADGSAGTQISYNSAAIATGAAYRCTDNAGPAPVSVTTASLPAGTTGTAYSQSLAASGGTGSYTWAVTSGSLPGGLTLTSGGLLSGTPNATGSFSFQVTATDTGSSSGAKSFTVNVTNPVTVSTNATLPGATLGSSYSQSLTASGGTGTYTWSVTSGSLPAGLTLSGAGLISGTPTAGGTFSFTVTATDGASRTGSKTMSLTVSAAPGAFAKSSPKDAATRQKTALSLSWTAATNVTRYEYCLSRVQPTAGQTTCDTGWISTSTARTVAVTLLRLTTYYWQVRAVNGTGTTYANSGTWWRFTTA
ncbi:MAG: S8 family serine peptidase [Ilumatobacteraceae bacterium]